MFFFSFLSFIFLFFCISFVLRSRFFELKCNIELKSLNIELHLCQNLSRIWKFSRKQCLFSFNCSLVNLLDQLVIDSCSLVMES